MGDKEQQARELILKESIEVFKAKGKVLLEFATGTGKSSIALSLAVPTNEEWIILVPRIPLFKTWEQEMIKWGYEDFINKSEISCYASAHKLPALTNANVILDEAHRLTERSWPYIKRLLGNTGKLICLSATIPYKKRAILAELGVTSENTVKYNLDSGVEDNLITDYRIKVIQFPLDNVNKQVQAGRKGNYFLTTEQAGYQYVDQKARQALFSGDEKFKKFMMLARMRFIYNLPSKLEIARLILDQIPDNKRIIVFCGSILHANAVCKHRFHSKTDDKDYENFCNGKINKLAVVQSVAEGVNIPNIDYALLMQVQKEDLHTIQRIGRSVRKSDDPNKTSGVFILEAQGSQDSMWVASAISSFDKNKIDYISYSQLLNKGLQL